MGKFKNPQTITSDHPDQEDFGYSVAIHNGYVVVGDPYKDGGSRNQGEVHVYRLERGEFRLLQKIQNPDGSPEDDAFGFSVAIHDGFIVVGTPYDNSVSGSVYVYRLERGEFRHLQRIQNPDGSLDEDEFGHSVAIHDGFIVVGAYGDNDYTGSVYVYRLERGEFRLLQHIPNPDGNPGGDYFGHSVAIRDGYIVVGAYNDNVPTNKEGSVYIYRLDRGEFRNSQKLESPDKETNGQFGWSVAIHNGRVVVGQPYNQSKGGSSQQGSAYIFSYGYYLVEKE